MILRKVSPIASPLHSLRRVILCKGNGIFYQRASNVVSENDVQNEGTNLQRLFCLLTYVQRRTHSRCSPTEGWPAFGRCPARMDTRHKKGSLSVRMHVNGYVDGHVGNAQTEVSELLVGIQLDRVGPVQLLFGESIGFFHCRRLKF